jgi:hypothetical protein
VTVGLADFGVGTGRIRQGRVAMASMSKPKRWYNPEAAAAVRVVAGGAREESYASYRWRHPRVMPRLGECLLYPLGDGPGLGLLVLFPPVLWVLSLPIFDFIAVLEPVTKSNWALGLLVVPAFVPMLFSFLMTTGYILVFLGHMLVASAMGENDHPRWPEWQPPEISEGLGRWLWAGISGVGLGVLPLLVYWVYCGPIDWLDVIVFLDLILVGVGFSQMALAAALMHDSIIAANPVTVVRAILRIGWDYVFPCFVASVAAILAGAGVWLLLFKMPTMWMEAVAIWVYWVFVLYEAMVVVRMIGLTYHAHAPALGWFQRRPRWASSRLHGRIYANC